MKVPFLDYKAVNEPFFSDISQSVKKVLESGWYVLGNEVSSFEEKFADYCGAEFCVGVSSGLDALVLILEAWKELGLIESGAEVIVPANTYIATILAISRADLKPILVEPELLTYNLDPALIEEKITKRTRVIIAVHLYGQCAKMDAISTIAKRHNLLVMEDAAQAAGATCKKHRAGNLGDCAAHSFYPGKNLGAIGEGGAVTTSDEDVADMIKKMRNYGSEKKYHNIVKGGNHRLDEIQAGILSVKLDYLDRHNRIRHSLANEYLTRITNKRIIKPVIIEGNVSNWHLFVVRTNEREKFISYLDKHEIQTMIHYPIPPHKQPAYAELSNSSLPITEKIHETIVSLPMSQAHPIEMIQYVSDVINDYK